jgi:inorganic phosphate transporter, PiT family
MTLFLLVLFSALVFEYINGFHDTANAIATVVSTKVLSPRMAVAWAAFWNLIGALAGTAVAKTISGGLVQPSAVTMTTVLAALLAAIVWNLFTWWLGLPSSSSHALIGGLCGAAMATAEGEWAVLIWSATDAKGAAVGLWPKVVLPMFSSPMAGFIGGAALMYVLLVALQRATPRFVRAVFGRAQLLSAGFMGFSHGSNDAQKTMGIITLALFTGTSTGAFVNLPDWASFLRVDEFKDIPLWVIITCAITMAAGTAAGGWRIIRTMGHKMVKMQPVHGFAAETTAAFILHGTATLGIPVSTTHVISTSIMGVGATKRLSAVKWGVVERIVWAWVLTIPITGLLGYGIELLCIRFGI